MLKYLIIGFAVLLSHFGNCQCGELPNDFVLEKAEDYSEHETLVISLMTCLTRTPKELNEKDTEESTAFCLIWLAGAPNVMVDVDTSVALFLEENPELLYVYIFNLALLEMNESTLSINEKEAEAQYQVALYQEKTSSFKDAKELKKIKKKYEKNKLVDYIKELRN